MNVFDSSALLAFLLGEPGSRAVVEALEVGGVCGAANWSEVAQKMSTRGNSWENARTLLLSYDLEVRAITQAHAEAAALMWHAHPTLSLADRLCLAIDPEGAILTADRAWRGMAGVRVIR